jgi:hypothetical protein
MHTTPEYTSESKLSVVHPGLFFILRRFPDRKDALRQMYLSSESFQTICHSYQQCSEAFRYWSESEHEEASNRQREYLALLQELELEIMKSLEEGP